MNRRAWWWTAKFVVSSGLLVLLLTRVDVGQAAAELSHADPVWVVLAMGATFAAMAVTTLKWRLLLRNLSASPPFWRLLQLNYTGLFYGMVLPGQVGGEVVKGLRLARDGVPPAHSAISIGMDRLTGLVALGGLGTGALLLAPATPFRAQFLALGAAIVLSGALMLPLLRRRMVDGAAGAAGPSSLPPAVRNFLASVQGYRAGKQHLALALVYSVDRKSTRLNSSHIQKSRMPSSA